MNTHITFSNRDDPVPKYNAVGRLLKSAVNRENTYGQREWLDLDAFAKVIYKRLSEEAKGKIDFDTLKSKIKALPPEALTHIDEVAQMIAKSLNS